MAELNLPPLPSAPLLAEAQRSPEHPGHFPIAIDRIEIAWCGGATDRSTQEYFLAKYGAYALNGIVHREVTA